MKRIIFAAFFLLACSFVSAIAQNAREGRQLFANEAYQTRHTHARRLNSEQRYTEAYEYLDALHRELIKLIEDSGHTAAELPCTADFIFYQSVLVSKAECAYMVNLWSEMLTICKEQITAVNERYLNGLGSNKDYYHNIASLYKIQGDYYYLKSVSNQVYYDDALESYIKALEFYDLAGDRQDKTKVYAELAQLKYSIKGYDEALDYMQMAYDSLDISPVEGTNSNGSTYIDETPDLYMKYRLGLAMCKVQLGDYSDALDIVNEEMASLSHNDKWINVVQRRKAKILMLRHENNGTDIEDAGKLYESYFKAIKKEVNNNFMQMTTDQREEYWMLQRPFVVDCYLLEEHNPELLYDITLYNKGILLQTARSFENLLKEDEIGKLLQARQQDAQNVLNGKTTTLAEDYEKKLLQTMTTDGRHKKFLTSLNPTWKDVQKALPTNGCAIEFVEYEKRDSMHFGALVLKKTGKPQFVHICNADELGDYCPGFWWYSLKELLESTDGSSKNDIYEDDEIRDAIWNADLISAIGNSRNVYFSADGYLHQLAIEYMLPEDLQDKNLYRLSSTRVLVDGNKIDAKKIRNGAAFVLGGIVYDSWIDEDNHSDPGNDAKAFNILQDMGAYFSYMEGAKRECDSIIYYRNNPNDLYLDSLRATEHEFYANCSKFPILHISTHGTFGGDKTIYNELLASSSKDVLSESVMALSNAGTHLRDKQFNAFNKDGLLSAREIARLNLENVELVTTSACQTGLGYITADGIYGMERGFKSAGAKGLVMTLWSVNIESARIFFTSMYRHMAEGESVHSAFKHARNDLLTKTYTYTITKNKFSASALSSRETTIIETKPYNTPQHANPYILIDVWE